MFYYIIIIYIYIYILNGQIENSLKNSFILLHDAYNCKSMAFVANFKLYKMVLKLMYLNVRKHGIYRLFRAILVNHQAVRQVYKISY